MRESGQYTRLGYWHDRKGENEIEIVAEDEFGSRLEIIEVKRNERNIDRAKADNFLRAVHRYPSYSITCRGLSLLDM